MKELVPEYEFSKNLEKIEEILNKLGILRKEVEIDIGLFSSCVVKTYNEDIYNKLVEECKNIYGEPKEYGYEERVYIRYWGEVGIAIRYVKEL